MKTYKARTIFSGFKIGLTTSDKYVGVPKHLFEGHTTKVTYGKSYMIIPKHTPYEKLSPPLTDKIDASKTYFLMYYKWTPYITKKDILRDHPSATITPSIKQAVMTTQEKEKALEWLKEARQKLGGGSI